IVFIDESGASERPRRVRTFAPKGKTPVPQCSFTWKKLSGVAGVTFWNICLKRVKGAVRAPVLRQAQDRRLSQKSQAPSRPPQAPRQLGSRGHAHRSRLVAQLSTRLSVPLRLTGASRNAGLPRLVRDYVASEAGGIALEFLPAPERNPAEHLWAHWKRHEMPNLCPKGFAGLSALARAKLKRTPRRKTLVAAFWKQAKLPS
ncbi:MAG: hypothetical protein ACRDRT_10520, partial [Pseudonocardiaceae bacterium]